MKSKIIIASILFVIGLSAVIDWIIFSTNKKYENLDWEVFKSTYVEHLPNFLQPVYQNPLISTLILFTIFTIAGVLFIKAKKTYLIFGIVSLVLASWQLFSLM